MISTLLKQGVKYVYIEKILSKKIICFYFQFHSENFSNDSRIYKSQQGYPIESIS